MLLLTLKALIKLKLGQALFNFNNKKLPRLSCCARVKEQPVQEYLTDSSGILGQINLETLNNVHAMSVQ